MKDTPVCTIASLLRTKRLSALLYMASVGKKMVTLAEINAGIVQVAEETGFNLPVEIETHNLRGLLDKGLIDVVVPSDADEWEEPLHGLTPLGEQMVENITTTLNYLSALGGSSENNQVWMNIEGDIGLVEIDDIDEDFLPGLTMV